MSTESKGPLKLKKSGNHHNVLNASDASGGADPNTRMALPASTHHPPLQQLVGQCEEGRQLCNLRDAHVW